MWCIYIALDISRWKSGRCFWLSYLLPWTPWTVINGFPATKQMRMVVRVRREWLCKCNECIDPAGRSFCFAFRSFYKSEIWSCAFSFRFRSSCLSSFVSLPVVCFQSLPLSLCFPFRFLCFECESLSRVLWWQLLRRNPAVLLLLVQLLNLFFVLQIQTWVC